ncbi:hypothetical protein PROFUN_04049 [Planoprotostelium fungivorum]|uniref:Uncharacterized protein n=1 Tax=Planoprotostelium fungivorum TaxID=1890364 RepID=A0A2P6NWB6_9EUKA|nr:hypothetical protein PROFUN_04049 [Planoprotostelium fungivorum]
MDHFSPDYWNMHDKNKCMDTNQKNQIIFPQFATIRRIILSQTKRCPEQNPREMTLRLRCDHENFSIRHDELGVRANKRLKDMPRVIITPSSVHNEQVRQPTATNSEGNSVTLCILLLASAAADPVSWLSAGPGCTGGAIAFETPSCWSSGKIPSSTDDVTISIGETDTALVIVTNITINSITVNKSYLEIQSLSPKITTLEVVNGGTLVYSAATPPFDVSVTSSTLGLNADVAYFKGLTLNNAIISSLKKSVYIFSAVTRMNGKTAVIKIPSIDRATINWMVGDRLDINGNYTSPFAIDSNFFGNPKAPSFLTTGDFRNRPYFDTPKGFIGLMDITFYTVQYTHWRAQAVVFGDNTSIILEKENFSTRPSIDLGDSYLKLSDSTKISLLLKTPVIDITEEDYYLIKSSLFQQDTVAGSQIDVVSSYADQSCQPLAYTKSVSYMGLQLAIFKYKTPEKMTDLEVHRGDNIYTAIATFSPINDSCLLTSSTDYVVEDEVNNRVYPKLVGGQYQATFKRVSFGKHDYRVTATTYDRNLQTREIYSNTFTYTRSPAGGSGAADAVTVCVILIVSCVALLIYFEYSAQPGCHISATQLPDNTMGGWLSTPVDEEKSGSQNGLQCEGCEKMVSSNEELNPHLGKMYCTECVKAIKQNNRRTVKIIKETDQMVTTQAHNQNSTMHVEISTQEEQKE